MIEPTRRVRIGAIAAALVAAAVTLLVLVATSARYPVPVVIGARPLPLFAALTLLAALVALALASDPSERHPTLTMHRRDRSRILAWWIGVSVALATLTYAAWKGWEVVALFATVVVLVKVLHVGSFITRGQGLRVWHPFALIIGILLLVESIGQFLGRPNLPPPIQAAMGAYADPRAGQASASRPPPDLAALGLTLRTSGDVDLGGLPATLFSCDDREGSRVDVYEASIGFPAPQGSVGVDDPPGWLFESFRLSLRTGPAGTDFLVVSWSTDVVDRVARRLA